MRTCVIFNPTAKGDKARRFRQRLEAFGGGVTFKPTTARGTGIRLAAEAAREGFEVIVAAGGDGTVNEVVNGLAEEPAQVGRVRLGVIPLGTVNVFAKELGIPERLAQAWEVVHRGRERVVDLAVAEFDQAGEIRRRCFAQLGGAGLDSRAVELVQWEAKKKVAQLAYIIAGLKAMRGPLPRITVETGTECHVGETVLIGNGRYYGARLPVFWRADITDGLLDACVFERVTWRTVFRYGIGFLTGRIAPSPDVHYVQAARFTVRADRRTPLELDGDNLGHLPGTFSVLPKALRVQVPAN